MTSVNFVLLAAGKGTRLKVSYSKILAELKGRKLIDFTVNAISDFADTLKLKPCLGFVLGHQKDLIQKHLNKVVLDQKSFFAHQKEQLGTAHAVQTFFEQNPDAKNQKYTFILCGDTPCIMPEHFTGLWQEIEKSKLDAAAAVFHTENPHGLGRIITHDKGFEIREQKEVSSEENKITIVNSGFYLVKTEYLLTKLNSISKSKNSGEFYLTDLFQKNEKVAAIQFSDAENFYGVNTLKDLEIVEKILNQRICLKWQLQGVRIIDTEATYIDDQVKIGPETLIYPNSFLQGNTEIGPNVVIESGCVIRNSKISDQAFIKSHSYVDSAVVGAKATIGPFAHLRPGADLGSDVKIGNFVEIKNSILSSESKVSHLSYVGDAEIGERTNIGCGFITCNYDGKNKNKTIIGKDAFIGSDSQMIAPVLIGNNAYIGSGSTINKNVADGDFAIARSKQVNIKNGAKRFAKK
jgi:bifunctional UDP-N-acetylglucosamine pyrophosphorylase/glucosamine-1-phosphate N-acetyltransferase